MINNQQNRAIHIFENGKLRKSNEFSYLSIPLLKDKQGILVRQDSNTVLKISLDNLGSLTIGAYFLSELDDHGEILRDTFVKI